MTYRPAVAVPDDLRAALGAAGLTERFEALPYSHRKQHVLAVEDAKTAATRERRIRKTVTTLAEADPPPPSGGIRRLPADASGPRPG